MRVDDREMERADAVRQREIDVGPGLEQRLGGVAVAGADGEGERRESAAGARVDVRARRRQPGDHGRVALGRRPHQGRLAAPPFPRVDRGAVPEQRGHAVDDAGPRGGHQRRLAVRRRAVRVGPGAQQHFHDARVPARGGQGQRRDPEARRGVDFPAGFQQPPHRRRVPRVGRPVQRPRVVGGLLPRGRPGQSQNGHDHADDATHKWTYRYLRTVVDHSPPDHQLQVRVWSGHLVGFARAPVIVSRWVPAVRDLVDFVRDLLDFPCT